MADLYQAQPSYALGIVAGTQVFTQGIGEAVCGTGEVRGDLAEAAGWVVNLLIAELSIWCATSSSHRRRMSGRRATAAAGAPS